MAHEKNIVGFNGVMLYGIEFDGCLNGVYTHIDAHGVIYNDIARKNEVLSGKVENPFNDNIIGVYDCQFFDIATPNTTIRHHGSLTISLRSPAVNRVYLFEWVYDNGKHMSDGIGYRMNDRQIAVSYWNYSKK